MQQIYGESSSPYSEIQLIANYQQSVIYFPGWFLRELTCISDVKHVHLKL